MVEQHHRLKLLAALGFAAALIPATAGAQESTWQWSITPYMWLSEIGVDASVNDREVLEREVDLADVLDDLDFGLQVHVEGQRGRHGLLFDLTYVDLGDEDKTFPLSGARPGEIVAKGDLEMAIIEAGGLFNPRGDGSGITVLYGVRILDVDEEIDARYDFVSGSSESRRYETSSTLADAMVGARYLGRLSDRWHFLLRADLAAGGTELTWNAWTGLGFTFGAGGRHAFMAGYRYMEIELEEDDERAEIESQIKMGGFIAGVKFGF